MSWVFLCIFFITTKINHHSCSTTEKTPEDPTWRFELDLPHVLDALKTYTGVTITGTDDRDDKKPPSRSTRDFSQSLYSNKGNSQKFSQSLYSNKKNSLDYAARSGKDLEDSLPNRLTIAITPPDLKGLVDKVSSWWASARRNDDFTFIEVGPGVVKAEIIDYPPNYQKGKLLNLIALKKKREKAEKVVDLNEGKEFFDDARRSLNFLL